MVGKWFFTFMDVSENSGTPKSSILIGCSLIDHPFWGTPIFGNTHMVLWLFLRSKFHLHFGNHSSLGFESVPRLEEPSSCPSKPVAELRHEAKRKAGWEDTTWWHGDMATMKREEIDWYWLIWSDVSLSTHMIGIKYQTSLCTEKA